MNLAKYSQLMLDPERLATFKSLSHYNGVVEGKKGGDLKVVYPLETPKQMGNVDQDFANWSVDFIKRAAQANKPFYLIHAFAKVHFDNYPGDGYLGRSPAKRPTRMQWLRSTTSSGAWSKPSKRPDRRTIPSCSSPPTMVPRKIHIPTLVSRHFALERERPERAGFGFPASPFGLV